MAVPIVLTAGAIAGIVGGRLEQGPAGAVAGGFSIDSRRVQRGDLFIALRGERFDGAVFAQAALDGGACGVIVPPGAAVTAGAGAFVVTAADPLAALQTLGRHVRRASGARVVAITGSAGKTSTKEMTASFLEARYRVYRNPGNLNNHIGLPLSLLELRQRPEVAVVELGMNHAGEIRQLVHLAEPDVRVWTNVGDAHLGHFASVEAIAEAKSELLEEATAATCLVANADDPRVMAHAARFPGPVRTFGTSAGATVRATGIRMLGVRGSAARIETPAGQAALSVPLAGRGQLLNVLAAATVALELDVPLDAIVERAGRLSPSARRGEVIAVGKGVTLVDDSYNSSPAALATALDALGAEQPDGRRVAVLGEMLELGGFATELHRQSGRLAFAAGVQRLVAIGGEAARALAEAAVAAGIPASEVTWCPTSEQAADLVPALLAPGDVVLVKGSRGTRTDLIADRVKAEWA